MLIRNRDIGLDLGGSTPVVRLQPSKQSFNDSLVKSYKSNYPTAWNSVISKLLIFTLINPVYISSYRQTIAVCQLQEDETKKPVARFGLVQSSFTLLDGTMLHCTCRTTLAVLHCYREQSIRLTPPCKTQAVLKHLLAWQLYKAFLMQLFCVANEHCPFVCSGEGGSHCSVPQCGTACSVQYVCFKDHLCCEQKLSFLFPLCQVQQKGTMMGGAARHNLQGYSITCSLTSPESIN